MKKSHDVWVLAILCQVSVGCVYGPFYDDTIPTTTSSVSFNLYASQPQATMSAECATHYSGFSQFGSTVASATPTTINGESIYSAHFAQVIPASCWDGGFGQPLTFLRFFQSLNGNTYSVQVFDRNAGTCIGDHFTAGQGPLSAGYACRKTDSFQQIRLNANL